MCRICVARVQSCGELLVYDYDDQDTWPRVTERSSSNHQSNFPLGAMQVCKILPCSSALNNMRAQQHAQSDTNTDVLVIMMYAVCIPVAVVLAAC